MKPILVLYATREGQTEHIAEYLRDKLQEQHLESILVGVAHLPPNFSLRKYSAAIVCASVHSGRYETEMAKFVKRHVAELQELPAFFVSVSLSEAAVESKTTEPVDRAKAQADVNRLIENFLVETGWQPFQTKAVAGALAFRKYNFVVRYMMKGIAEKVGASTDTSRNHEFTDWSELDKLAQEFAGMAAAAGAI
jgi:menaquinone-dependent protoporphyrinogen oxidase